MNDRQESAGAWLCHHYYDAHVVHVELWGRNGLVVYYDGFAYRRRALIPWRESSSNHVYPIT